MKQSHQLLFAFTTATLFTMGQTAYAADQLSTGQVEQVKGVVHDYLITNPQVLVEASQALQKQEVQKIEENAKKVIAEKANAIFADPNSPVVGNPKGNVTLVEFFDYQCSHCKDAAKTIEAAIAANPNLRVVYKELPIFGESSKEASRFALASLQQGADKYTKFHNALLAAENPLNKDKILSIAKSVGLDTAKLEKDMQSEEIKKELDDNFQLAQALNIMGTPSFILSKWEVGAKNNNVKGAVFIPGKPTLDELKKLIADAK